MLHGPVTNRFTQYFEETSSVQRKETINAFGRSRVGQKTKREIAFSMYVPEASCFDVLRAADRRGLVCGSKDCIVSGQ